jgi:DNA primase catalytic core
MSGDRLGGVKTLKVSGFLDEFEKDEIKRNVDIISLFTSFGVSLEQKGKSHIGNCPFHDDKTPSLSVDRGKGLFNCFGCGESGDVFDLVQKIEGIDFKDSLKYLKEFDGSVLRFPQTKEVPKNEDVPKSDQPKGGSLESVDLDRVMEFYQKSLFSSKESISYLETRGIGVELLSRFGCGYSNGKLKDLVSSDQKNALKEIGIFNEKGFESFQTCVVFPLLDSHSKVTGLYGRKLANSAKVKHLYLKGPRRGLLNRKAASVYREEIILTESIIDALSLIQLGVENVIPCYGTNGFTDEHLSLLKDERVKLVTIAFDNDDAGRRAAEKLIELLVKEGFPVKVIYPSGSKDWNEFLTLRGEKKEVLELLSSADILYPKGKSPDFSVSKEKGKYVFTAGEISYRLLGVKELFVSNLRVNIRAEKGELSFIDNSDLYSARSRTSFSLHLSRLFDTESKRIEKDLIRIVEYLEEERDKSLSSGEETAYEMTESEIELGMEFLTSADMFDRIVQDTELLGYVGEEINKILIYLAASSRKLDDPISVIVMSESAAGKSYLIDTVKKLIPPEDVVSMTSLSDQALNYLPEEGLKHKFLVMGEAVHSEVVEHQIREMLSAHELSRLVTTKDEKTGQMTSKMVKKEVTVSAVMSSTDYDLNAENTSRSFVVNTDESTDQTRRIHASQKMKYSTERLQLKKNRIPEIIKTHHAAQRLLKKVFIVNTLAEKISFPDTLMRSRRDHDRFMDLIATIAFLRQYQKEEKEAEGVKFIECDMTDLKLAVDIMKDILPATLTNFPKSAISLYEEIRKVIEEKAKSENLLPKEVSVTQRELREKTGLNQMFVKRNLRTLIDFEYLICLGSQSRGSRNAYRLVADESIELMDLSKLLISENPQS